MMRTVLPALGLLVVLAFALGMLFVGFASLETHCERQAGASLPNCQVQETRLFGLYQRSETALNVQGVGYSTQDVDTSSRVTLSSTVVLRASNGSILVSQVVSNVGGDWKADVLTKVRAFLDAKEQSALSIRVEEHNVFGWIGLGIGGTLVLSTVAWAVGKLTVGNAKGRGKRR